ncbi:MAG: hypothetical protein KDK25_10800 [Leptospiraceae bacterium]|nr:hypothetical protein [Leptospiraceae bacterium]
MSQSCAREPVNHGFCGIIPGQLEAALSYATSLYLGQMPDQDYLSKESLAELRSIPPLEVRTDPEAPEALQEGLCAFSIFDASSLEFGKEKDGTPPEGLALARSPGAGGQTVTYSVFLAPDVLLADNSGDEVSAEAIRRTVEFLKTLWSDEFQNKLPFYNLQPVEASERSVAIQRVEELFAPPEP